MTGFGEAELDTPAGRLRVELKTVNHRFFSAQLRLPLAAERFDGMIREWLRAYLPRGHVNFSLRVESADGLSPGAPSLDVDYDRARAYFQALTQLKEHLGLPGDVDMALLSRYGDLIVPVDEERLQIPTEAVKQVTEEAARTATVLREEEGRKLGADLEERLKGMEAALAVCAGRAPARLVSERDRLRAAVSQLAGDIAVDDDRLAREVAFLAERWDISEELVRLRSHIQLFRDLIGSDDPEPVGKRLGFLVQEMHREANTIGSKANDAVIEHQVIALKDEIERLREQVDNVE